jgi:putative flippase GtrA
MILFFSFFQHKLVKFASVGLIATFVHALFYLFLLNSFNLHDQLANLFGFLIAFAVSYVGQRGWAFSGNKVKNEHVAKIKFALSSLVSLGLNALFVFLTVNFFHAPPPFATIGIVFITPLMTFFVLDFWVFR